MPKLYSLSSYQYHLPSDLIAQQPCTPRDHSRLMVVDRAEGTISEMVFHEIFDLLQPHDQIIFNDTKVIPARLLGKRGEGKAEIFLIRSHADGTWEVLAKPGKKLKVGTTVTFSDTFSCEIVQELGEGRKKVKFTHEEDFHSALNAHGQIPLPQYIKRDLPTQQDAERYQTVYAQNAGAVAAPTAGLHFTTELMNRLTQKNVNQAKVTLHVGLGTFRPVQTENIREHKMHTEQVIITPETAQKLNSHTKTHRQICVGTTTCRALESIAKDGQIFPGEYETDIFIYPGYKFQYVKSMLTNFHLPGSSLLMLVCAFAGYELAMEAYQKAVHDKFRFYSYGDAMLIL